MSQYVDVTKTPGIVLIDIFRYPELFDKINSYLLSPIALIALRQMNKDFLQFPPVQKAAFMSLFRRNLAHLLSSCGYTELTRPSEDGYESVLRPGKCILSGSVVLQAILGEEWVGSDIDMYVTAGDVLRVRRKLFRKMGYQYSMWPKDNDKPHEFIDGFGYFFSKVGSLLHSLEIWESTEAKAPAWLAAALPSYYPANGPDTPWPRRIPGQSASALQMIVLKDTVARAEDVLHTFDLDIVMNTWDGQTLRMGSVDALMTRVTQGSEYVRSMTAAFGNVSDPTDDKFLRLCELEDRDLVKINREGGWEPGTYKQGVKKVFRTLFGRLYKYSMRGFVIMAPKLLTTAKLADTVRWLNNADGITESDTESEGDLALGEY